MEAVRMSVRNKIFNLARSMSELVKYLRPRQMAILPEILYFQVTDACNANCVFCGYQYYKPRGGSMPLDVFEKGVKEYAEMGGRNISLSPVVGEPLLDPHLFGRIEIARKYGIKVKFYTNGILLNDGIIKKILNTTNLSNVVISTAGFERQMFERIMRSRRYDKFLNGVEQLLRENTKMGNPVDIRLALRSDKRISDAMSDVDFVERILPHIPRERVKWVLAYDNWCGMVTERDLIGEMILAKPQFLRKKPCASLFVPMITMEGKVRACSCRFARDYMDDLIVGDINEKHLREIWLGSEIKKLRQRFYDGALPKPCENCSAYEPASPQTKAEAAA